MHQERNDEQRKERVVHLELSDPDNGPKLIMLPLFADERGMFMETFNEKFFREYEMPYAFVQDNLSETRRGVIRGMHIQSKKPQGKLLHCIYGAIQDVCVDMREGPNFGKKYEVILQAEVKGRALLYVPPGFAHGFCALEDCIVSYKCTTLYDKDSDGGINPLSLGIEWQLQDGEEITISAKDKSLPSWVDYVESCR